MAKSGPKKEKPKAITVHLVKRTRRSIFIAYTKGDEQETLQSRDNPLPAFFKAMDALVPVVGVICHLPEEYCDANLKVVGIKLGSQGGAETVSILAQKSLDDAGKALKIVTPARLLDTPTEEGNYTPPISVDHADRVSELVLCAKDYIKGERAQGQLELEDSDDDDEKGEGEQLPFAGDAGTAGKPTKKK